MAIIKDSFEITIPVLNEENELETGVLTLGNFLLKEFPPDKNQWSIVIADNGSTDRTKEIAENMIRKYPWLKYIHLDEKGVGRALKASWGRSGADIIGYLDLDLATDLKHVPEALIAISRKNYDIVYGTRLHKDSKVIGRTLKREITSRSFNYFLRIYLKNKFSDGMCGFKFLRRKILNKLIAGGCINEGWFFSTELLIVSEWHGFKIFELPINWHDSKDSKVKILSLTLQYLKAMRILKKKHSYVAQ